jgi:acetyl-CoA carboxylase biotin carboxylase subunit
MPPAPFRRLLVANRGEIAVRVLRTCRRLGIEVATVHSEADAMARWVKEADASYLLGPAPAVHSYLDVEKVIGAARRFGAQAIHPGYGFLSERASFARACEEAGLSFVGPPPAALERSGSKTASRAAALEAGVVPVPGSEGLVPDLASGLEEAKRIGFPVLLKADAGGGGIGLEEVSGPDGFEKAWKACASRGKAYFGDGAVYVERKLERPRHVEVQLLADEAGTVTALGERECSLQRRRQKVVEETPSVAVDAAARARLFEAARAIARAIGYRNAGTVEFLLEPGGRFYFLEVNARLQVEHPVTEETTGLDLVEWQLRLAAGEKLPFGEVRPARGHAIEFRVYAEDPDTFLPAPGSLSLVDLPGGDGIRYDFGFGTGDAMVPYYDPLIGKLVVSAPGRAPALQRARDALGRLRIEGTRTNLPLLRRIAASEFFAAGEFSVATLERSLVGSGRDT